MERDSTPYRGSDEGRAREERSTFPLGQIVATPGALGLCDRSGLPPLHFIVRHGAGDWGDLCEEDVQANESALKHGGRLFSGYAVPVDDQTERMWCITEADRSTTTLLLPDEY